MEDFAGDMQACKTDECYRNTWTAQYGDSNYNQLSLDNLKDALETVGPARAGALLGQIQGGLVALAELQCSTPLCHNYKFTLIDRALTAKASLEQTYGVGGSIIAGLLMAPLGAIGGAVRGATAAETNGVQKAYAYWAGVRGPKGTLNTSLLDELAANDVKFTPANALQRLATLAGKLYS